MNTPTRLAGFVAGLAAVFAGAIGIGAAAGPLDVTSSTSEHSTEHAGDTQHAERGHAAGSGEAELPGGLMISNQGYTLDLDQARVPANNQATLRFRIVGPGGTPVTAYDQEHGKDLHLIVVRRDLTGYQHVHPTLDADGVWSAEVDLSEAGTYRAFADFTPAGGEGLTLGSDIEVGGTYEPRPLPVATRTTRVGDYTVTLDGTLVPGESTLLTLSVSKHGKPVTDLQPYLEAYGHLVALRDGDLAYLHVHPDGSPDDGSTEPGPGIRFYATAPSAGDYRLFLDFKHGDEVRTAAFTARAGAAAEGDAPAVSGHGDTEHAHSH